MIKYLVILFVALLQPQIVFNTVLSEDDSCILLDKAMAASSSEICYMVTATIYHADPRQTNADFTTTADGSKIDITNPSGHRWIAVSRDMLSRYGGQLEFGDSLKVEGTESHLDGIHIVRDLMNKRYQSRIDFLVSKDDIFGKWETVKIVKI